MSENNHNLDQLRLEYKTAVDDWVAAIREEEGLAIADHSMTADEVWEQAQFREDDARKKAQAARDAYKDGMRHLLYGI